MIQKWYLFRDGAKIGLAQVDQQGALAIHAKGHELGDRPYDTREEAEEARIEWMNILMHGNPRSR